MYQWKQIRKLNDTEGDSLLLWFKFKLLVNITLQGWEIEIKINYWRIFASQKI